MRFRKYNDKYALYNDRLWTTSSIPLSYIWYDATLATSSSYIADVNTLGGTNSYFLRLYDRGTASNHLYQEVISRRARYVYDATKLEYTYLLDEPYFGFYYGCSTQSSPFSNTANHNITHFCVVKTPNSNTTTVGNFFEYTSTKYGNAIRLINGELSYEQSHTDVTGSDSKKLNISNDTWYLIIATSSLDINANTQSLSLKVNNVIATQSAYNSFTTATNSIVGVSDKANLTIGEIITYNRILDAQQIDLVESYLKNKWSISY